MKNNNEMFRAVIKAMQNAYPNNYETIIKRLANEQTNKGFQPNSRQCPKIEHYLENYRNNSAKSHVSASFQSRRKQVSDEGRGYTPSYDFQNEHKSSINNSDRYLPFQRSFGYRNS